MVCIREAEIKFLDVPDHTFASSHRRSLLIFCLVVGQCACIYGLMVYTEEETLFLALL